MKTYYHIYSDGKKADIPFGSDELKIFAVNSIAIVANQTGVDVLCYEINDTHLHTVIRANPGEAEAFRTALSLRIVRYYGRFGYKKLLGGGFFLACEQAKDREDLLRKIIYTFRNCLDFYNKTPWNYKWGVGDLYFSDKTGKPRGFKVGDLSRRAQKALFHTYYILPPDWEYDRDGMLLPECFVDYEHVENLFVTPRAYIAFMFVKKEDEHQMQMQFSTRYILERSLQDIRSRGDSLCNSYFGRSLRTASFEQRLKVAAKIIREGSAVKGEGLVKALYLKSDDLKLLL